MAYVDDTYALQPFPHGYFVDKAPQVAPKLKVGEYLVEKILGHRVQGGEEQYLAQWEGFPEPSWHPVRDFINDELMKYWKKPA